MRLIITGNIAYTLQDRRDEFKSFNRCRLYGVLHTGQPCKIISAHRSELIAGAHFTHVEFEHGATSIVGRDRFEYLTAKAESIRGAVSCQ